LLFTALDFEILNLWTGVESAVNGIFVGQGKPHVRQFRRSEFSNNVPGAISYLSRYGHGSWWAGLTGTRAGKP
jgi:hypothetical protein